ncbi:IscS subfamily cysteine desulfurase [Halioxenophilus aromaticivorans]|uniref:cysteine desulfurase n=1 Tax=Halioxenophilus aromaticivorans TaxID=1306992 RepID=A0AAV3U0Z0_9ALTE
MKQPIYLDYAATTPVDPRVAEAMTRCLTMDGIFANPASRSHRYGWQAEEAVENARRQVADLIATDPRAVVWTSGATEANNLAIKGVAQAHGKPGSHFITSTIEHKAVLDCFAVLEEQGYAVTYLQPNEQGEIEPEQVAKALRPETVLVSLMLVNNELGVINDIEAISQLCRQQDVLLHVDAAQGAGKLAIDAQQLGVDLMSLSAHKVYGPKGVGALYVRRTPPVVISAQMHGGGHERGMRSGTLATHQCVGMGEAFAIAKLELEQDQHHYHALMSALVDGVLAAGDVSINGAASNKVANIVNFAFHGQEGDRLMMVLKDLAVSSGSACTSASVEPSYVLQQIGVGRELAHASLRFSVGRFTQMDDIDRAVASVQDGLAKLSRLS